MIPTIDRLPNGFPAGLDKTEERLPLVHRRQRRDFNDLLILLIIVGTLMAIAKGCLKPKVAEAGEIVNMSIIAKIESNNNCKAVSPCGAIGVYQIMPCVLQEYNNAHKGNWAGQDRPLSQIDLFYADTNYAVARWYIMDRIPAMLKWYGKPITIDNILWTYNSGIGNLVRGIKPRETRLYIAKYHRLSH